MEAYSVRREKKYIRRHNLDKKHEFHRRSLFRQSDTHRSLVRWRCCLEAGRACLTFAARSNLRICTDWWLLTFDCRIHSLRKSVFILRDRGRYMRWPGLNRFLCGGRIMVRCISCILANYLVDRLFPNDINAPRPLGTASIVMTLFCILRTTT